MTDDEVFDIVATLVPDFLDTSAAAATTCAACPAGTSALTNPATVCTPCAAGSFGVGCTGVSTEAICHFWCFF